MPNKLNIGIIGYGVVGRATANAFEQKIGARIYYIDTKDANITYDGMCDKCKYIFICVPTPTNSMGVCRTDAIVDVLKKLKECSYNGVVVIKSTVPPETTKKLRNRFKMSINFNPEFLSEDTAFQDAMEPQLLVIGGGEADQINKDCYGANPLAVITDTTTAEMIKYFFNCLFLLKVVYANQMFDVCEITGANYETVLKAAKKHPWVGTMHFSVFHKGYRGASGKCLPKDAKAMSGYSSLLKEALKINEDYLHSFNKKASYED